MALNESKKIFCNNCHRTTNHRCVGEFTKEENYKEGDPPNIFDLMDITIYRLWICAGCESGTMEETEGDGLFEDMDIEDENIQQSFEVRYYPERMLRMKAAKQFRHIPEKLERIYRETLLAYNVGSNVLCAIGIRTLIEGITDEKRIRGGDLREKIDKLEGIPQNIVFGIHKLRFIGNKAAHELNSPNESELELAIEICEDLLNFFYELKYKAKRLKKPRRRQNNLKNARPGSIQHSN